MMGDYARGGLDLDDEDRLPWLEPADQDNGDPSLLSLKLIGLAVAALVLLGVVVGGVFLLKKDDAAGTSGADAQLIKAPPGEYKVPANEADAKKFAGEGDAAFAASEGVERAGRIDPGRVSEVPVTGGSARSAADTPKLAAVKPAGKLTAPVKDGTRAATEGNFSGGGRTGNAPMIQLGAYGSQSSAREAWARLSKRFDYLAPLGTSVESVKVGETTLYRLRASAGSARQAGTLCGKLRVAGESCLVVN